MALRALRRYHSRRMKAKAKKVYPGWKDATKWADYLHGCSCYCCCNVRRSSVLKGEKKLTRQERLALLRYHEGLEE